MVSDVIIGAGLAGLSAGISLLEKGRSVHLVEAGSKLTVKTCGEFLSYESLPLLERWGIRPNRYIHKAYFHYKQRSHVFLFPMPAGSMPRLDLENALLERFIKLGGAVSFGAKADLNSYPGCNLIVSAGRWQGKPSAAPKFIGIKNHFTMKTPPDELHMFFSGDSYFGISPLNDSKAVFSCLAKASAMKNPEEFIQSRMAEVSFLKDATPTFQPWLVTPIGRLGIKKIPSQPNTYFLGDARGTVAPIIGEGMTMALTAGVMAAEFIIQGKWQEFQKAWLKRYKKRIHISKMMNRLAFCPLLLPLLRGTLELYPSLLAKLFASTRD